MPDFTFRFVLVARETRTIEMDIYESDTTTQVVAESTDEARFKLWLTDDAAPTLDLDKTATANGSSCTITVLGTGGTTPATVTIKFAQLDTAIAAATYNAELGFIDDSETVPADAYTVVARGLVEVIGSATGDRGKA